MKLPVALLSAASSVGGQANVNRTSTHLNPHQLARRAAASRSRLLRMTTEPLERRALFTWIGATTGTTNDAAHQYDNAANWSGGVIDDSFAGATLSGNTTLYLAGNRTTAATGLNLNYGGAFDLLIKSSSATARTLTLAGNVGGNFGGSTVTIGDATNAISVALGASARTFTSGAGQTLTLVNVISGAGGLIKSGAGTLTLSGINTYTGGTTLTAGQLNLNNAKAIGTGNFIINGGSIDNTTAGAITLSNNNAQSWAGDFTFVGTQPLNMGTGAVSLPANRSVTIGGSLFSEGGVISGVGALTKNGVGTLTLSGANTFTGGATLVAGQLNLNNAKAVGTGMFTIAGGAIDNTSGAAVTLSTANAQTWDANISFLGSAALNLGTGAITLTGDRTIAVNSSTLTLAGVIGDAGNDISLAKTATGTLTLSGANTFTGGVRLAAGQLNINHASALGTGTFEIDAGTIDNSSAAAIALSTNNAQIWGGDFSFVGTKSLNLGTGSVTLDGSRAVTTAASTLTIGGVIDDGGFAFGLSKSGAGTLSLTASNTFAGGVAASAGTLNFGQGGLGTGTITFAASSTLQWATGNTQDVSANIADVAAGVVATIDTFANSVSFASSIGGAGVIAKAGTGALTFAAANTHAGGTTLGAGTLNLNQAAALGTGTFTISGGTINNSSAAAITLSTNNAMTWAGNFTFTGTRNLDLGTGAVTLTANRTVTASANTLTVGGSIGGAFSLAKAGNGALTLPGANTYTGGTTLTAGTLNINHASAIPAGTLALNGGTLNNTSGAPITLANNNAVTVGGNIAFGGTNVLNLGTGAITLTGNRSITVTAGTTTLGGVIGGAFALSKAGNGALALANANTYSGGTTLSAGTLAINNDHAIGTGTFTITAGTIDNTSGAPITLATNNAQIWGGTVTVANGNLINFGIGNVTLTGNRSVTVTAGVFGVAGSISGAFALTKSGAGTLAMENANTYSATTLSAGTLQIGDANAIGAGTLTLSGGTLDNTSGAALTLSNNTTFGGSFAFAGTDDLVINGNVALTGNRVVTTTAGTLSLTGAVSGAFSLTKAGAGALILAGANTYTGGTVLSAGELDINHASAIGTGTLTITAGTIDNTSGNAITLAGNNAQNWGGNFSFGGADDLAFGTGTITLTGNRVITTAAGTLTLRGVIAGAFALTKSGPGTLLLTGASTFSAGLTLNDGTLIANNTTGSGTGSGAVTVNANATLAGTGRASGAVTINSGGTLSPGNNSTAIFNTGNLILNSGATLTLTLDGDIAGTEYDAVNVAGTVTIASGVLTLSGTRDDHSGANLTIISNDAADAVTGAFAGQPQGSIVTSNGVNYSTSYLGGSGNDVVLSANLATTSTSIVAGAASTVFGEAVTFTATVISGSTGTPTGVATFLDGGIALGSATLDAFGVASFTTTLLDVGSRAITAVYGGDSDFASSASSVTPHEVAKSTSAVDVQSSLPSAMKGQSLTLTATVTAVAPGAGLASGDVTFMDGVIVLGVGTLDGAGMATFVTDALDAGDHAITATYTGDSSFLASTSASFSQTVQQGTTTVTLGSSLSPSVVGQAFTLTANVFVDAPAAGTLTGHVTFMDGSTVLGVATVDGAGVATFDVASLGAGTHALTAVYGGDLNFEASTSGASTQAVDQGLTTTSVFSTVNGSTYGQATMLIATVMLNAPAAGTPTGTVTFFNGAAVLGVGSLNASGQASLSISLLAAGTHQITAEYAGDAEFSASTSASITQNVAAAATSTSVTTTPSASVFGQLITVTATVSTVVPGSGVPFGTVTFKDGAAVLGVVSLDSAGAASFAIAAPNVGSHSFSAEFSGSANFSASTSAIHTQSVGRAASSVSLSSDDSLSAFGESITFTAHVAATAPGSGAVTGTVDFYDGASVLGSGTLDGSGNATLSTMLLDVNVHSITAVYVGDAHSTGNSSSAFTQTVVAAATTIVLGATSTTVLGEMTTLSAIVTTMSPGSGIAGGIVTFKDGADVVGTAVLNASGVATFSTSSFDVGTHAVTATYAGNIAFASSVSSAVSQVVHRAATAIVIASSAHPTVAGQVVNFTATVEVTTPGAGLPSGTITFRDGSIVLGTAILNSAGIATLSVGNLAVGNHSIVATYFGDSQFTGSQSTAALQSVQKAATTLTLQSALQQTVFGQITTFNAHVAIDAPGNGAPSGDVVFSDGATVIGTATLDGAGNASLSIATLAVGTHAITAGYSGDVSALASVSTAPLHTVAAAPTAISVQSSHSASQFGQSVTLTATIAVVEPGSGTPAGDVTFRDGVTVLGVSALDAFGVATLTIASFDVGDHVITAEFDGDGSFLGSDSPPLLQQIDLASTSLAVDLNVNPAASGQTIRISATITAASGSGIPSGTIEFRDGTTSFGSATLDTSGVAFFDTAALAVGGHAITAVYLGDNHHEACGAASTLNVVAAETQITISTPAGGSSFGGAIELTASVSVVSPGTGVVTGNVRFFDGVTLIGSVTVDSAGRATLTASHLSAGEHHFSAVYEGGSSHAASTSVTIDHTVRRAETLGEVALSKSIVITSEAVKFTMTVVAGVTGVPTGTVSFFDGETALGSISLDSSGHATWVAALAAGTHVITASYGGDANFLPTRTPFVSLTVTEVVPTVPPTPDQPAPAETMPRIAAQVVRSPDQRPERETASLLEAFAGGASQATQASPHAVHFGTAASLRRSPTSNAMLMSAPPIAAADAMIEPADVEPADVEPADVELAAKKVEHEKSTTQPASSSTAMKASETPSQTPASSGLAAPVDDEIAPLAKPAADDAPERPAGVQSGDVQRSMMTPTQRATAAPGVLAIVSLFFTHARARRLDSKKGTKSRRARSKWAILDQF